MGSLRTMFFNGRVYFHSDFHSTLNFDMMRTFFDLFQASLPEALVGWIASVV